ncbi:uncharacterized protein PG998_010176 [Apiospora kogelbergensis]|uniref:uncharacterized protein n=1 Tax=Apiospora kogelbergensis TaxID=1337665 RepID=UPI00313161E9
MLAAMAMVREEPETAAASTPAVLDVEVAAVGNTSTQQQPQPQQSRPRRNMFPRPYGRRPQPVLDNRDQGANQPVEEFVDDGWRLPDSIE